MAVIYILWLRELKRYTRSKVQILASLGQPLLYLLVLGFGLASWFARPLRRMAQIAARVDAGDLSPRIDAHGPVKVGDG